MITQEFIDKCKAKAQEKANKENKTIYVIQEPDCIWCAREGDYFDPRDVIFTVHPIDV